MPRWTRSALTAGVVLAMSAGLLAVGTALGAPSGPADPQAPATGPSPAAPADQLARSITDLQATLARAPGRWRSWSELGLAYVQQARLTADPGFYARADGAFARSLALRRADNDLALTGQATLAAARHDFAGALALTDRALRINPYSATTFAVRADSLTELGRYDQARTAIQSLLDLRPGVDGYTRASYAYELRGDVVRARALLQQAADEASAPADVAFAQYYLGELAWNSGDLDGAQAAYERGLAADDRYLPLVAGRAKVLAARGDVATAIELYRSVVQQLPAPEYLVALGELLQASGRTAEAQEQYAVVRATQQLYAANGQDVDTELALFEADHGTPAAAVASARKAYARRPNGIYTQDAYAWALNAAGRSREALPIAKAAVRLGLRNPQLYYRLGVIAAAAGDRATARAALTKALALNPQFSPLQAPKARALLGSLG